MRKLRKGFTLIELLIVIVIIGILAAIAIPKFGKTREKAYFKAMQSDLRNMEAQQEIYYSVPTEQLHVRRRRDRSRGLLAVGGRHHRYGLRRQYRVGRYGYARRAGGCADLRRVPGHGYCPCPCAHGRHCDVHERVSLPECEGAAPAAPSLRWDQVGNGSERW